MVRRRQFNGATAMSAKLENIALPDRVASLSRRLDASGPLADAAALLRLPRRLFRRPDPRWHELSLHMLADIGETPASADQEALRNPFDPPLGQIGCGKIDGRSLFARRTSPLG
jgi:hypothetical protein